MCHYLGHPVVALWKNGLVKRMTERRSLGHVLWSVALSAAVFLCFRLFHSVTAVGLHKTV